MERLVLEHELLFGVASMVAVPAYSTEWTSVVSTSLNARAVWLVREFSCTFESVGYGTVRVSWKAFKWVEAKTLNLECALLRLNGWWRVVTSERCMSWRRFEWQVVWMDECYFLQSQFYRGLDQSLEVPSVNWSNLYFTVKPL